MIPAPDMPALESWLREEALRVHNVVCSKCLYYEDCENNDGDKVCAMRVEENVYNKVLHKIQNARVDQHAHKRNGVEE